jgi:hypothetical protein
MTWRPYSSGSWLDRPERAQPSPHPLDQLDRVTGPLLPRHARRDVCAGERAGVTIGECVYLVSARSLADRALLLLRQSGVEAKVAVGAFDAALRSSSAV